MLARAASRPQQVCRSVLIIALCLCAATGCVRRRMTIRSNPPGALVFIDDQRIGVTPVSTSFTYYGTRKIQLFKDGFETQTIKQRFFPPWYEFPPLDFISENLWPGEVRDERVLEFDLPPQAVVPNEQLVQRAESLRSNTQLGHLTPLPNLNSPPAAPRGPEYVLPPMGQPLP